MKWRKEVRHHTEYMIIHLGLFKLQAALMEINGVRQWFIKLGNVQIAVLKQGVDFKTDEEVKKHAVDLARKFLNDAIKSTGSVEA